MKLGSQIRLYREKSDLTIEDIAKRLNLDPSILSKYESDEIDIDYSLLKRICIVLNVPLTEVTEKTFDNTLKIYNVK